MKQFLAPFIILLFVLVLGITNFKSGTFLTGWDNLHPEFNFPVNIQRSVFAVWQEYQGLGLLGGMGHASDLIRQVFLLLLSTILPISFLRYFWTMLTLFAGSLGVYFLIRYVILGSRATPESDSGLSRMTAFLGSLFYICNLATIQTFYVPFEVFTTHFAALPWLFYTLIQYAKLPTRKHFFFFVLTSLLSAAQGYVPTLFLVYIIGLCFFLPSLYPPTSKEKTKVFLKKSIKIGLVTFFINAFWLLPFLYFTFTNVGVNLNAKINQMATENIFQINKEFGNISDVMLLKGFWFNNVDPNNDGIFAYMLGPWRDHLANPFILGIGYTLFLVVILGVFQAIKTKKPLLLGFVILFFFSITMLATNTPPFSWINVVFRKIPLFSQAFRFPFTKFSILAALTYSIFFAIGIQTIMHFMQKRIMNYELRIKAITIIPNSLFLIPICLLIIFTFPAFQGHIFYEKERLKIPKEYFQLFDFFKKQNPNTRIANFPQYQFWGWSYYNWGYGGSGFLWYGIKQPILDRAFDVWSKTDENYYFEVSHALYAKNPQLFAQVLNKYQVTWILIDQNIINPFAPKALFYRDFQSMIKEMPAVKKVAMFGRLSVYKFALQNKPKDFVSLFKELPNVNGYTWSEVDRGYADHNNYFSSLTSHLSSSSSFYPFRSLFSNKLQKDLGFSLANGYEDITFSSVIPQTEKNTTLTIPSLLKEDLIPVDIIVRKEKTQTLLTMKIATPQVFVDTNKIWGTTIEKPLFVILPGASYPLELDVNGLSRYTILDQNAYVQRTFIASHSDNVFVLRDPNGSAIQTQTIPPSFLDSMGELNESSIYLGNIKQNTQITVKIQKINDKYIGTTIKPQMFPKAKNCDNFRTGTISSTITEDLLTLSAKNATSCISVNLNDLPHRAGYAIFIPSVNISGRPFHFWVLNNKVGFSPIDTYLAPQKSLNTFILAPQDSFGKGYSVHLDNISIGSDVTINAIGEIAIYPIPYAFLTNMLVTNQTIKNSLDLTKNIQVTHPNESLYLVTVPTKNIPSTLVLSQSFAPGWKAYEIQDSRFKIQDLIYTSFPFIFGKEVKDHVLVNNWANGWILDNNYTLDARRYSLVIVFLPQYLEYLGFLLLAGLCGFFGLHWIREKF